MLANKPCGRDSFPKKELKHYLIRRRDTDSKRVDALTAEFGNANLRVHLFRSEHV